MKLHTLISARDLAAMLSDPDLLIVDCRFDLADKARGARDYAAGHIAGAVFADLESDLSDLSKSGLGRHPLPDEDVFSMVLGRWGWKSGMPVVVYDEANGALASARLWWMLRAVGESNVAVLDGGLAAWKAAGLPLESTAVSRTSTNVTVHFDKGQIVDTATLQQLLQNPQFVLLDARAAPRFRGEVEPIDRVPGHVPGARNRPFSENLETDGRFKSAQALRTEFERLLGATKPGDVVNMCGSGVTACHNLLALEHAGLSGAKLYAPSFSGWISDPSRPVAR